MSCRACLLSYCFFGDKKIAFKSSLDLYFHSFITKFEEKIHTKAVVDVSRGAEERVFLFSLERLGGVCWIACLTCLRAFRVYVLACSRASRACLLGVRTCYHAWHACVLTCLRAWVLGVLTCLTCLHARVLGMLLCSCAWRACVLAMMKCFTFLRVCMHGVLSIGTLTFLSNYLLCLHKSRLCN